LTAGELVLSSYRAMKIRFAVGPPAGPVPAPDLISFAVALEANGFDGIWLSDLPVAPVLDPLLALALLAGRTRTLRLGANIVPFGRSPYVLAKALAQLDQLSDGRLLLSFVTGLGQPGERGALGLDGANRGAVLEEVLGRVRSCWGGEAADVAAPSAIPSSALDATRPLQDPLEVWLGGRGPTALERVGRLADGWLGALVTADEAVTARERIQASAANAGREVDPEHFGMSIAYARAAPHPSQLTALTARRTHVDPRELIPVGRDGLRALVQGYIDAGLSKFVVRPAGRTDSWESDARWLADAILDLQT
jgi:probable F420-dependent oxidoreductase